MVKRYSDNERKEKQGQCYDCGVSYSDFGLDLIVSDDVWDRINPTTHQGGGLLCPNCICKRLAEDHALCIRAIPDYGEEWQPPVWIHAKAFCRKCGYKWYAITTIDCDVLLECPQCHEMAGMRRID